MSPKIEKPMVSSIFPLNRVSLFRCSGFPILAAALSIFLSNFALSCFGAEQDIIGLPLLQQVAPALRGSNVPVAQAEAPLNATPPYQFEVNPGTVGQPVSLFTYISTLGSDTTFPNLVGSESGHADGVAGNFYSPSIGAAPGVSHVYNYEAGYFYDNIIAAISPPSIPASIVNQSFIFCQSDGSHYPSNSEAQIDIQYDDYAAAHGTLFVSGAGNGGQVFPSATCYNGIGVGVYPGSSSYGPSYNGRCKPDIVSPGSGATSFSTPYVSGSAAVLKQAGNRGDGGANTNSASDMRTIKALLLNGAIKPSDWTNSSSVPLDYRYGAGVLNIFNSWQQLKGGQRSWNETTSFSIGAAHPPGTNTANLASLVGWDLNGITNTQVGINYKEQVNHYYINATGTNAFTFTTTLTWNRQSGQANINDLNLYLYNTSNSNLVACSTSLVDNVEHIFLPSLAPGRYDLQVWKSATSRVSDAETYALAFETFNVSLTIVRTNSNLTLTWPLTPTGFRLLYATNLNPPIVWTNANATFSTNTGTGQNVASININATNQFFRLQRP